MAFDWATRIFLLVDLLLHFSPNIDDDADAARGHVQQRFMVSIFDALPRRKELKMKSISLTA